MSTSAQATTASSPPVPERDLFATMALIRAFETPRSKRGEIPYLRRGDALGYLETHLWQNHVGDQRNSPLLFPTASQTGNGNPSGLPQPFRIIV